MRPSPWLADFLKTYERFRPTAYLPTKKDRWTIGYGHTNNVKEGDKCSMDTALEFLADDMSWAVEAVELHVTVLLTQNQFDALCSLTFNIGEPAFSESTLLRKLNDRDYGGAAAEFPKWDRQCGKKLAGLDARRLCERNHFLTP